MAAIGVVADDYTGTASAGVLVARSKAKTGLFFDTEAVKSFQNAEQLDAIYVSSNSRNIKPEEAYEEVRDAAAALKGMGIKYFSKKIDTTLRGNIGQEIDAMLDILGKDTVAVMVTAMPQSRRICVGGYSVIDGVILTETCVAQDVKSPVKESNVLELIGTQTSRKACLITLNSVLAGEEKLARQIEISIDAGCEIIIIDAITLEHIEQIAKACVTQKRSILAVDPGAFTMKLAYQRGLIQEEKPNIPMGVEPDETKTVLGLIGSASPATKVQVEKLRESDERNVIVQVSPLELMEGGERAEQEVQKALGAIKPLFQQKIKPKAILIETALHLVVDLKEEDRKHHYQPGTSSMYINAGLAKIGQGVLSEVGKKSIAGLFLTGGDTMECVCRALEVECIQAVDHIVAQIDVGRMIGKYNGMPLVAKGGFCGNEDIGIKIVDRLLLEAARKE